MNIRSNSILVYMIACFLLVGQCICQAKTHAAMNDIMREWDSIASMGILGIETDMIAEKDLRFLIQEEMKIMVSAREYVPLLQAASQELDDALFIIRISERREYGLPVDSAFIRNDTIIRVYGKPLPGSIRWIVGKSDGSSLLLYEEKGAVKRARIDCGEALLEGISSIDAGGYYPVPSSIYSPDLVSIWSPTIKRHLFVTFLRGAIKADRYYLGNEIPSGIRTIASVIALHSCIPEKAK